ncbi:hypothetical protein, partial [Klebsiella pneumoniae]|uniref:hypothetical protein n=1 Tax=Klebsiella pneumoniae TaxID=573 RepID=UPI003C6CEB91
MKSEFEALRMRDSESVDEFAGKLTTLASKIRGLGEKMDDDVIVKKILGSVPDKFLQVVAAIEQFA